MTITFTTRHTRKPHTYEFQIVKGWSHLTWKQAILLADLTSRLNMTEAIIQFFLRINKLHVVRFPRIITRVEGIAFESTILRYRFRRFVISDLDMSDIVKQHSWIYGDQQAPDPAIIVSNILPSIARVTRVRLKETLLPPANALTSLTYEQYTLADVWFQRFVSKGDIESLNQLIATLYTDGTFNPDKIETNLSAVKRLSFPQKTVILWFYLSCRKFLAKTFIHLFEASESDEKTKSDPILAWMKLTSGMIETPADISETKKQLVWDVFSYLDEKIKAFKAIKKKQKK